MNLLFTTLIALFGALGILLYLDASTLFLAALLLSVICIKTQNKGNFSDKVSGLWFALSVAPATGVEIEKIGNFENGFLAQLLFSSAFFLYFYIKKPSIISRLLKSKNTYVGLVLSSTIAGFAAGTLSGVFWQAYLQIVL